MVKRGRFSLIKVVAGVICVTGMFSLWMCVGSCLLVGCEAIYSENGVLSMLVKVTGKSLE